MNVSNEDTSLNKEDAHDGKAQQVTADVDPTEIEHVPKEITIDKRRNPQLYYMMGLIFCTFIVIILSITLIVVATSKTNTNDATKADTDSFTEANDNNITKTITVLLLSDIHEGADNIARVREYIASNDITIDHLWAPGDFMNLNEEDQNENTLPQAEDTLHELLQTLRSIHPSPVIIAGNHDPKTLFNKSYQTFGDCINIHKQLHAVEGEDNLFMAGFGGSVPGFKESQAIWVGYPFATDAEYGAQYNAFINSMVLNDDAITNRSVVLFNHVGPLLSSTSIDWRHKDKDKVIYSGSEHITNVILNEEIRDKLICSIHGHAHLGVGQARIGGLKIINPGSSRGFMDSNIDPCNNFALLHLNQYADKTWDVADVQFIALSP